MSTHPQVEIEKPRFGEVFLLTKGFGGRTLELKRPTAFAREVRVIPAHERLEVGV
jgi:hypothetical protein